MILLLSLLSFARAACPSAYNSYDCTDNHAATLCSLSSTTYSCSAALGSSTNATLLYATVDMGDGTYNVYGTDSDSAGFCCSVASTSVTYLVITGGAGDDAVLEGYGTDVLCGIGGGQGLSVTVYGAAGADTVVGSAVEGCSTLWETFYGGPGDDILEGEGRTVTLYGEANNDWVIDAGNTAASTTLSATLIGGDDADVLESANYLGSVMLGGDGNDTFYGYSGPDEMHGGTGSDGMSGGSGDDSMWGDAGYDVVAGDAGTDSLYGGTGNDTLCGGADNGDLLWGGHDDDILDDDGTGGFTHGEDEYDVCDSTTTADAWPSCNVLSSLSYQCGGY